MNATRFRLYGDSEIDRVTRRLQSVATDWAAEWLAATEVQVRVERNARCTVEPAWRWWVTGAAEAGTIAVGCPMNWLGMMPTLLTGVVTDDGPTGDVAPALGDSLLAALVDWVADDSGRAENAISRLVPMPDLSAELSRPGNGYLGAEVTLTAGVTVRLVLWPQLLSRWLGDLPAASQQGVTSLVPAQQGLDAECVTLDVVAGSAELTLTEFQSLAVGDVIRLDRRLVDPLAVLFDSDERVAGGHLGTLGGRRAVQLVET